jgi:hypothetical protein
MEKFLGNKNVTIYKDYVDRQISPSEMVMKRLGVRKMFSEINEYVWNGIGNQEDSKYPLSTGITQGKNLFRESLVCNWPVFVGEKKIESKFGEKGKIVPAHINFYGGIDETSVMVKELDGNILMKIKNVENSLGGFSVSTFDKTYRSLVGSEESLREVLEKDLVLLCKNKNWVKDSLETRIRHDREVILNNLIRGSLSIENVGDWYTFMDEEKTKLPREILGVVNFRESKKREALRRSIEPKRTFWGRIFGR